MGDRVKIGIVDLFALTIPRKEAAVGRCNIEVSIKVDMKPTQAPGVRPKAGAQQIGPGQFQIVLEGEKSLDIDALEDGLLQASFPALRGVLARPLEEEVKKSRADAS